MGKIKYISKVREFSRSTPIVSIASLKKIIGKRGDYVYLMVNKMLRRGELHKITRGMYSIYSDPIISVFCFKPSYLGLQDALSVHNLWEQETNVIILTTKIVREGVRKVFDSNVIIKRINPKYFFGFDYVKYGGFYVPVSDVEKTFIDFIYFNQPLDSAVINNFRKRIDRKKLQAYLRRYDSSIANKVLNIIDKKGHKIKK